MVTVNLHSCLEVEVQSRGMGRWFSGQSPCQASMRTRIRMLRTQEKADTAECISNPRAPVSIPGWDKDSVRDSGGSSRMCRELKK